MKAQMFVVTAIFLATMLFSVQQAFITYSKIDMSEPFDTKQPYIIKNIIRSVNESIINEPSSGTQLAQCQRFQRNLEELLDDLKFDVSREGYLMESKILMNCVNWGNAYPASPPLKLSLRLSETYEYNTIIDFYHIPVTVFAICQSADINGLCDGLEIAYSPGYKDACCSQHSLCCCVSPC